MVKPQKHEEAQEAIDREIHQHHYHTTVQPIAHQEKLPEKHVANVLPAQEKTFTHNNEAEDKARAARDLAQFKNTTQVAPVTTTTSTAPAVTGEHVHHHGKHARQDEGHIVDSLSTRDGPTGGPPNNGPARGGSHHNPHPREAHRTIRAPRFVHTAHEELE